MPQDSGRTHVRRRSGERVLFLVVAVFALLLAGRAGAQCCACLACAGSGFCLDDVADPIACATLCDAAGCPNIAFQIGDTCADGCDGQPDLPTATPTITPGGPTLTPTDTPTLPAGTATATFTPTPFDTPTLTPTEQAPITLHVDVGTAVGQPGSVVGFAVTVDASDPVDAIQVCLQYDAQTPIHATETNAPDCTPGDSVAAVFSFFPAACTPGASCTTACGALTGAPTLPVSGTLFTCRVAIAATAVPATYPLACSVEAQAPRSPLIPPTCADGSVIVQTRLPGDCNGDGQVSIDELILGVNIALGIQPVTACPAFDTNADGQVSIDELIAAVNVALNQQ
jgi:hypothetical protein